MAFSNRKVSLKHLLVLCYTLAVVLLIALLGREVQRDRPSFSLSHANTENAQKSNQPNVLAIYGEDFHSGIRGVFAKSLLNAEALLWHQLVGVSTTGIDVKDDLALVSYSGKNIISIGLDKDKSPEILDSLEMPESIMQFKIVGDQALVGLKRQAGLSLIDLKNPGDLKLVRHYPLPGFVSSMVVDQSTIYYTNFYQGVGRIVLSAKNPVPEMLAALDSPLRIGLQGHKLVVGTVKGGVHLFDITLEGGLVEAGSLDYQNVRGVAFTDEVLAVALADGTLHLLDLSSWPALNATAQLTLPGSPILCERISGQAGLAVGLVAGGVVLIDVSVPVAPTISGFLKMPSTFRAMKLQPGKFYAVGREGLQVFSLDKITGDGYSPPAAEATYGSDDYQLQSWNGHVYGYTEKRLVNFGKKRPAEVLSSDRYMAFVGKQGVSLFEQRENGQVQRAGSLIPIDAAKGAIFRDNYLYIVHHDGLRIFSGTRPEELVVVSDLKLPGRPVDLEFLDSTYLLVTTLDDGVLVFDISDPQQPTQIASVVSPRHLQSINVVQDVLVDGSRIYISLGAGGVHIVDLSSPSQPELLQIIDTPGHAKRMALYDKLLLVADGINGLFLIDVDNRKDALPIGTLPTPLRIEQVAVVDNGLVVSSHPAGTMKLPLPQRVKNLQLTNKRELRINVERVENGQYLYLYDGRTSEKLEVSVQ
jgi:hypothetical protein